MLYVPFLVTVLFFTSIPTSRDDSQVYREYFLFTHPSYSKVMLILSVLLSSLCLDYTSKSMMIIDDTTCQLNISSIWHNILKSIRVISRWVHEITCIVSSSGLHSLQYVRIETLELRYDTINQTSNMHESITAILEEFTEARLN